MTQYFSISNWQEFQHYKDRNPPWIKLHNQLLDNYEFEQLTDATKVHLLCIWMLASRTNNKIVYDPSWVKRKIGANSNVDLKSLISAGFIEVQGVAQDASKALVSEEERRGETEKSKVDSRFTPPTREDVNNFAIEKNLNLVGFYDYYESNGWRVGKNKMKKWQSAATGWSSRQSNYSKSNDQDFSDDKTGWANQDYGLIR
jgi:hypothetical protein